MPFRTVISVAFIVGQLCLPTNLADVEAPNGDIDAALTTDTECQGRDTDDSMHCSVNALQKRTITLGDEQIELEYSRKFTENLTKWGSCAQYGCGSYNRGHGCQCNSKCGKYQSCCADYASCIHHQTSTSGGGAPSPVHTHAQPSGRTVAAKDGIEPPSTPMQYNGMAWPTMKATALAGTESHILAIGDWGGMDGTFQPPDHFPRMVAYPGGAAPGPHVFPRSRIQCSHKALTDCYFPGKYCDPLCGFVEAVDSKPQLLVAEQFKKRAALHDPQFILNVGDNFYWGGIAMSCGSPMNQVAHPTVSQFNQIFENVYSGPGIDGKRWLSALGNHDWGGRMFSAAWDQQIAYTWASDRWMLPAAYWSQLIEYPDYSVEVFIVDTNFNDAEAPAHKDVEHNICGSHNRPGASCPGGPPSLGKCKAFFDDLWAEEQPWLDKKLAASSAGWQIVVTHFPCDHQPSFWRRMHSDRGLDLLVTGHRHDQELWKANQPGYKGLLGGLTCFVTGGGGGITSEESILPGKPSHHWPNVEAQYGFFDITISKEKMKIESIDYTGKTLDTTDVYPKDI